MHELSEHATALHAFQDIEEEVNDVFLFSSVCYFFACITRTGGAAGTGYQGFPAANTAAVATTAGYTDIHAATSSSTRSTARVPTGNGSSSDETAVWQMIC
jgi:hypothetical protein